MRKTMKRFIPLLTFLIALSVQGYAEQARRFFEIGADAGLGFGNNFLGALDIFKKNILIDLKKADEEIGAEGFQINADEDARAFINIAFGEKVPDSCKVNPGENGFGLSVGAAGGIFGTVPKSIVTFLAEGNINEHSPSGDLIAYGGIFADAELDVHFKIGKKLRIGIVPSMYIPIVYIPKSSINYKVVADGNALTFSTNGAIDVYSPFSLEEGFNNLKLDTNRLLEASGYDLSLNVGYDFLSFLNIGADITHIPLVPSTLKHQMHITGEIAIDGSGIIDGGNIQGIPNAEDIIQKSYSSDASYTVMRPLRFDLYGLLHWEHKSRRFDWLRIRPNVGFTVLNPAETFWFNAGIDLRLNLINFFIFHIGTGYEETLWKHKAGIAFNLRVFELDIEVGLRSQDFVKSFQLNGLQAGVGVRLGF